MQNASKSDRTGGSCTSCALGVVLLGLATATPARAQTAPGAIAPEPITIEIESGDHCVTESSFYEQIRRRTPLVRPGLRGGDVRHFVVKVSPGPSTVGQLRAENPDRTQSVREVAGKSCTEVVDALALVAALSIDPHADTAPQTTDSGHPAAESLPVRQAPVARQPKRSRHSPPSPAWQHGLAAEMMVLVGVTDVPMPAVQGRFFSARDGAGSPGPLATLGVFRTFDTEGSADGIYPGGKVRYRLFGVTVAVCPVGHRLAAPVRIFPCIAGELGRLEAEGVSIPNRRRDTGIFAAAGLQGLLLTRLVGPLALLGGAGVTVPLTQYSVRVDQPDDKSVSLGRLGFTGSLGLVVTPL